MHFTSEWMALSGSIACNHAYPGPFKGGQCTFTPAPGFAGYSHARYQIEYDTTSSWIADEGNIELTFTNAAPAGHSDHVSTWRTAQVDAIWVTANEAGGDASTPVSALMQSGSNVGGLPMSGDQSAAVSPGGRADLIFIFAG